MPKRSGGWPECRGLDLIDPEWLHVTTYIAGFCDEVPGDGAEVMAATAAKLLSGVAPIPVTLGRIWVSPEAVVLPLEPFEALRPVATAVRQATLAGGGNGHLDTDPWTPHVSVAYSHDIGPAAPVIAAAGRRLPALEISIASVSLVAQLQVGRSWQWRPIADIALGETGASAHFS